MTKVEFRDGVAEVPDHVAVLLTGIATHTLSHAEALALATNRLASDRANAEQHRIVREHLRNLETPWE